MVGAKANRQKASAPFGGKDFKNFVCIDGTLYFFETVKSHGNQNQPLHHIPFLLLQCFHCAD
jgi:hypothetical protein